MRKQLISLCMSFVLVSIVTTPGRAQSCLTNVDTASYVVAMVANYAAATDSIGRAVRGQPADQCGDVAFPRSTGYQGCNVQFCECSLSERIVGRTHVNICRQVYVVQSGKSYVVWDPSFRWAPGGGSVYGRL
jgi:hypothetical protein